MSTLPSTAGQVRRRQATTTQIPPAPEIATNLITATNSAPELLSDPEHHFLVCSQSMGPRHLAFRLRRQTIDSRSGLGAHLGWAGGRLAPLLTLCRRDGRGPPPIATNLRRLNQCPPLPRLTPAPTE